jgi:enoyl-CoA hydratase
VSGAYGPWRLEADGPLQVLTLAHPPVNLYDRDVETGLHAAIRDLAAAPPRALLIRAEGKVWTGGVDVHLFDGLTPEQAASLWDRGFDLVHTLEDMPCPVIFAAHALCLTWGLEVALACDLLLAAESAKFGLVETRVGLTPSMGGPQRMAERAGPARARHFVMTGEILPARTLEAWGVVSRVYADDEFEERSRALARELADGPTRAHAATKAIVAVQKERGARAADAITPEVSGALFATEDLRNAVTSFLTDGPGQATYSGR